MTLRWLRTAAVPVLAPSVVVLLVAAGTAGCSSGAATPSPTGAAQTTPVADTTGTPTTAGTPTGNPAGGNPFAGIDPCKLLTATELGMVIRGTPKTTVTPIETQGDVTQGSCDWHADLDDVQVYVESGLPPDQLALSFAAESNDAGGKTIAGLGDKAWVFSDIPVDIQVDVITGDVGFYVEVNRPGASGMEAPVLALANAVLGRV
ncbi:MAG TPA: hypothetical protein VKB69_10425 [Micromonosporaceae bacterium]|nr:hypothetical protein [Micromonosporaceae bacterium]